MSLRIEKINKLIKKEVSKILTRELSIKPGVFLTVSKVDTTKDLRYSRVSVSVFPEEETDYVKKTLNKEAYSIQGKMNKKLHLNPLPRVEFKIDQTEVEADEVEKILKKIEEEK